MVPWSPHDTVFPLTGTLITSWEYRALTVSNAAHNKLAKRKGVCISLVFGVSYVAGLAAVADFAASCCHCTSSGYLALVSAGFCVSICSPAFSKALPILD